MYWQDVMDIESDILSTAEQNDINIKLMQENNYYFKFYVMCIALPIIVFIVALLTHWVSVLHNDVKTLKKQHFLLLSNKLAV